MKFEQQKKKALNDYHASVRVGDVDEDLIQLLDFINELEDYYTTSSCSGRIVLYEDGGGKGLGKFLGKWHLDLTVDDVRNALKPSKDSVWFKSEPPILHVVARTLEKGDEFLVVVRDAGFRRVGIQTLKPERYVIEIIGSEKMDAPVAVEGKTCVGDEYLDLLVCEALKKHAVSKNMIKRLLERLCDHVKP